ncbi:MAG: hypothetical protein CVV60_03615 [Tenericutes bacterium HGW-Tenericutes-5]|nr:MAG: hypothetical protein CVV60_03615 [Tenericutes bacterium HGW-Tenericutes-5]
MKLKSILLIPSIWIGIVSTLYSFIYVLLLWFDYFSKTSIHGFAFLFYPFVVLGIISLLLSYPILRIVKSKHFAQVDEDDSRDTRKRIITLSKINLFIVVINLFAFASWVTFVAGPGV